jgi:ankyrin repeat protein
MKSVLLLLLGVALAPVCIVTTEAQARDPGELPARRGPPDPATRPVMAVDLQNLKALPYTRPAAGLTVADVALLQAAEAGSAAEVKKLVQQGARVNARDASGRIAIVLAAASGDVETVRTLADAGAEVDVKSGQGYTPLGIAALRGHWRIVQQLLAAGASVDARSDNGNTPLLDAVLGDHPRVVDMLTRARAAPNA